MKRLAAILALLLVAAALATFASRRPAEPPPLAVNLARVESAPAKQRTPGVILTVTAHTVDLDASALLAAPRREVTPMPHARSRYDLRRVVDGDEGEALQGQLELLFELAGQSHADKMHGKIPVRARVAGDVRMRDLLKVLSPVVRANPHVEFEVEVATATGVGHFTVRPYTWCACGLPPNPSWCAAPDLWLGPGGVTLVAVPDLTPPIGCHKAIRSMGEPEPTFSAEVDWRDRVIAGPDGGCPSAQIGEGGLDVAALSRRLAAVRRAAPGCGWASVGGDPDTAWGAVAPALAALYAEFGEVPTLFNFYDDPTPLHAGACKNALPLAELVPQRDGPPSLMLGRRGCSE